MGSARSAFVISALLCLSNPAISAELDASSDESRPSGVLGHTIIRVYGAVIPEVQDYDLDHPGWGTGLAVSYGVARAVSLSLELAYYRFQRFAGTDRGEVRQASMFVGLQPPIRSWLRPWFGAGFGVYEFTTTLKESSFYSSNYYPYYNVTSGTQLGFNWGVGVSAQLDQRVAIDLGSRYHHGVGRPFLATPGDDQQTRLISVQAGLSYVVR